MISIKNLYHKIAKLEWSKILWNSKKALVIYLLFIFGNIFATYYYSLNIAFFVGVLATATSIFVSYLTIKNTNELDYKKTQRDVFFKFVNELMRIANYKDNKTPYSIDNFSLKRYTKSIGYSHESSDPKEMVTMSFSNRITIILNDVNVRTQLNKYFINLINTPSDFYYLPTKLQRKIRKYTSEYRRIHETTSLFLNKAAKERVGKFEQPDTLLRIPENSPITTKIITKYPYKYNNNSLGNFLILGIVQTPENIEEYGDETINPKDKYCELYLMEISHQSILQLNVFSREIFIETSEELLEIIEQ